MIVAFAPLLEGRWHDAWRGCGLVADGQAIFVEGQDRAADLLGAAERIVVWDGKEAWRALQRLLPDRLPPPVALCDLHLFTRALRPEESPCFEDACEEHLGRRPLSCEEILAGAGGFAEIPARRVEEWAVKRAAALAELHPLLAAGIAARDLAGVMELEHRLLPVVGAMEDAGLRLDIVAALEVARGRRAEAASLAARLSDLAGRFVSPGSYEEMTWLLFEKLGLPKPAARTDSGEIPLSAEGLAAIAGEEAVRSILRWRAARAEALWAEDLLERIDPRDGRVHATFHQYGTATGRFSSHEPPIQFLRRELKFLLAPAPGQVFVRADYSQVEMRVMADLSGDERLVAMISSGEDLHRLTAAAILGKEPAEVTDDERQKAKTVNFGVAYGQTPVGLAQNAGMTLKEAEAFIADYFEKFSGLADFIASMREFAREHGFVRTVAGRKRPLDYSTARTPGDEGKLDRRSVITTVQGSAADIMKTAMVRLAGKLEGADARLVHQIHDELVLETSLERAGYWMEVLSETMRTAWSLRVPLEADPSIAAAYGKGVPLDGYDGATGPGDLLPPPSDGRHRVACRRRATTVPVPWEGLATALLAAAGGDWAAPLAARLERAAGLAARLGARSSTSALRLLFGEAAESAPAPRPLRPAEMTEALRLLFEGLERSGRVVLVAGPDLTPEERELLEARPALVESLDVACDALAGRDDAFSGGGAAAASAALALGAPEAALVLLGDAEDPESLLLRAEADILLDRFDEAMTALSAVLASDASPEIIDRTRRRLFRLHCERGDHATAGECATEGANAALGRGDHVAAARYYVQLGELANARGEGAESLEALAWAARVLLDAEDDEAAAALVVMARARLAAGATEEALAAAQMASDLAARRDDAAVSLAARELLGDGHATRSEWHPAAESYLEALRFASFTDLATRRRLSERLAEVCTSARRYAEALMHRQRAERLKYTREGRSARGRALLRLAKLRLERQDATEAESLLEEAVEIFVAEQDHFAHALAAKAQAEAAGLRGDVPTETERLLATLPVARTAGANRLHRQAVERLRELGVAAPEEETIEDGGLDSGNPFERAEARLTAGDAPGAAAAFREALAIAGEVGDSPGAERALAGLGEIALKAGDEDAGIAQLEASLHQARESGRRPAGRTVRLLFATLEKRGRGFEESWRSDEARGAYQALMRIAQESGEADLQARAKAAIWRVPE